MIKAGGRKSHIFIGIFAWLLGDQYLVLAIRGDTHVDIFGNIKDGNKQLGNIKVVNMAVGNMEVNTTKVGNLKVFKADVINKEVSNTEIDIKEMGNNNLQNRSQKWGGPDPPPPFIIYCQHLPPPPVAISVVSAYSISTSP